MAKIIQGQIWAQRKGNDPKKVKVLEVINDVGDCWVISFVYKLSDGSWSNSRWYLGPHEFVKRFFLVAEHSAMEVR